MQSHNRTFQKCKNVRCAIAQPWLLVTCVMYCVLYPDDSYLVPTRSCCSFLWPVPRYLGPVPRYLWPVLRYLWPVPRFLWPVLRYLWPVPRYSTCVLYPGDSYQQDPFAVFCDLSQGTCDLSQGTFDLSQGTCDLSQGTCDLSQGTCDLSQGTCVLYPGDSSCMLSVNRCFVTCLLDPDGSDGCGGALPHPGLGPHPEVVPGAQGQLTHRLVGAGGHPGLHLGRQGLLPPVHRVPEQMVQVCNDWSVLLYSYLLSEFGRATKGPHRQQPPWLILYSSIVYTSSLHPHGGEGYIAS